jgi:hypothetical protein
MARIIWGNIPLFVRNYSHSSRGMLGRLMIVQALLMRLMLVA